MDGSGDLKTMEVRKRVLAEVMEAGLKKMVKIGVSEEVQVMLKVC